MTSWNLNTPAGRLGAIRDGQAHWPEVSKPVADTWPIFPGNRENPNVIGGDFCEWGNYDDGSDEAPDVNAHGVTLRASLANDHLRGSRLHDTRGYYTDREFQDDTLRPIVVRLSHGRTLAGYTYGPGMSFSLDRTAVYDDVKEAARAAHDYAERAAEAECDYQDLYREAEARAERGEPCALIYQPMSRTRSQPYYKLVGLNEITRYERDYGYRLSEKFGADLREFGVTLTAHYQVFATDADSACERVKGMSCESREELNHTETFATTYAGWPDPKRA